MCDQALASNLWIHRPRSKVCTFHLRILESESLSIPREIIANRLQLVDVSDLTKGKVIWNVTSPTATFNHWIVRIRGDHPRLPAKLKWVSILVLSRRKALRTLLFNRHAVEISDYWLKLPPRRGVFKLKVPIEKFPFDQNGWSFYSFTCLN